MKATGKLLSFFLLIVIISCIKEDHYNDIEEVEGVGLPIEVNPNLKVIQSEDAYFNSFDETTNVLKLYTSGETLALQDSNILVIGLDTSGVIRRVIEIDADSDPIVIYTEPATMEDVFIDAEFKLSTELTEPDTAFKSANIFSNATTEALTDDDGFIHPVKIIYHTTSGEHIVKSALAKDPIKIDYIFGKTLYTYKDFSKTDIYEDNNIHAYIDSGYVEFAPVFKFEFDFAPPNISLSNLKISKGELNHMAFYSDRTKFDFLTKLKLEIDEEWSKSLEEPKKLLENKLDKDKSLLSATFVFTVGPVPVYMDVSADLFYDYDMNFSGHFEATTGFQSTHYVTVGAEYDGSKWNNIYHHEKNNTIFPLRYEAMAQFDSHFELYPHFEVQFYKVIGPYIEIVPYVETYANYNRINEYSLWNANVDLGLNLRAGVDVAFLNKNYQIPEIPLLGPWELYAAPDTIIMVSGSGQTQKINKSTKYPLVVKVEDILGNEILPDVYVFFQTDIKGNFTNQYAKTDKNGLAETYFTSREITDDGTIKAFINDGDGNIIGDPVEFNITVIEGIPPEITTSLVDKTTTTAKIKGNVKDNGDFGIAEKGIIYGTSSNLSFDNKLDKKIFPDIEFGDFTIELNELDKGQQYYVAAYVVTKEQNETFVGGIISFKTKVAAPEITISPDWSQTETSITVSANITSAGGGTILEKGFVYHQSKTNPTIYDNAEPVPGNSTQFSWTIANLDPDQDYYVRAYAKNETGQPVYSSDYRRIHTNKFDNITKPEVVTSDPPDEITSSSAKLTGRVTNNGNLEITDWEFHLLDENHNEIRVLGGKEITVTDDGSFYYIVEDLTPGTTYNYYARAYNEKGWSVGNQFIPFTTLQEGKEPPVVVTLKADVSSTSVRLHGNVETSGSSDITKLGFYYDNDEFIGVANIVQKGNFYAEIDIEKVNLAPGTYYYKSYAKSDDGSNSGESRSFEIEDDDIPPSPTITTLDANNNEIEPTSATLKGKIVDNGATINETGIEITYPYSEQKQWESNDHSGEFSVTILELTPGQNYRYKAYVYANNSNTPIYGEEKEFTCKTVEPKMKTFEVLDTWSKSTRYVPLNLFKPYAVYDKFLDIRAGETSDEFGADIGTFRGWCIFDITGTSNNIRIEKAELVITTEKSDDGIVELFVTGLDQDPRADDNSRTQKKVYESIGNASSYASKIIDFSTKEITIPLNSLAINKIQELINNRMSNFRVGFKIDNEDMKRIVIQGYSTSTPPKIKISYYDN